MTGFIKKLFGSKPKPEIVEVEQTESVTSPVKPGAYFLSADDAKTFGNIDYMRSSKSVRRTFPKEKLGKDNELIRKVSAMQMEAGNGFNGKTGVTEAGFAPAPFSTPTAAESNGNSSNGNSSNGNSSNGNNSETDDRRKADTSMDMFRSMAKEIRKG